jgi:hypothetical protein
MLPVFLVFHSCGVVSEEQKAYFPLQILLYDFAKKDIFVFEMHDKTNVNIQRLDELNSKTSLKLWGSGFLLDNRLWFEYQHAIAEKLEPQQVLSTYTMDSNTQKLQKTEELHILFSDKIRVIAMDNSHLFYSEHFLSNILYVASVSTTEHQILTSFHKDERIINVEVLDDNLLLVITCPNYGASTIIVEDNQKFYFLDALTRKIIESGDGHLYHNKWNIHNSMLKIDGEIFIYDRETSETQPIDFSIETGYTFSNAVALNSQVYIVCFTKKTKNNIANFFFSGGNFFYKYQYYVIEFQGNDFFYTPLTNRFLSDKILLDAQNLR